ncbi:putative F-box domain-containing protein [Tanacetum coccineum]
MAEVVVLDEFEEILLRLDAEDLLRCKSVCKSWYSLISSPYFVKAHLKHACNNNRELGHFRIQLNWKMCFVNMMVGSSNGLVCISPYLAEFLVTNPSTREVKQLPTLPYRNRSKLCWGFGYDSSTDDYKLVVGANQDSHLMRFQVLSLKSNQWKFLGELNYDYYCRHGPGFLYNGALHWFMDDPNNSMNKVILAFDLSLEKFKEIPPPDDTTYVCDYRTKLGIFEECLCVFRIAFSFNENDTYLPTWVMKNYNVKQSWELIPCDYEKNEVVAATPAYMVDYDISCNSWRLCDDAKGNIDLSWRCWDNIGAPIFVKSLVSPYLCGKPEERNNKSLKVDFSYNSKHTMLNKKRKRHAKNNKRNDKVPETINVVSRDTYAVNDDVTSKRQRTHRSDYGPVCGLENLVCLSDPGILGHQERSIREVDCRPGSSVSMPELPRYSCVVDNGESSVRSNAEPVVDNGESSVRSNAEPTSNVVLHTRSTGSPGSAVKKQKHGMTLDNDTSLIFGKFIHTQKISNLGFPEHYLNFAAYNELAPRAISKSAVLTHIFAMAELTNKDVLAELTNKDPYRLPSSLQELEDSLFKPPTFLLPAPTPVQSSTTEVLSEHPEHTVTSEDDPTQIRPNQPINPTPTTPSDNQAPSVLSGLSKAPAEESTPPTEEKTTLVQKEERRNRKQAVKKLSTQGAGWKDEKEERRNMKCDD